MTRLEPGLHEPAPEAVRALAVALREAPYSEEAAARALGPRPFITAVRAEAYRRRLAAAGVLGTLVRLFRLGDAVPRAEAVRALAPAPLDELAAVGILEVQHALVSSRLRLTPFAGLLLFHDPEEQEERPRWHVPGIAPGAKALASLTVRLTPRRALDVGTGCGVHALLAARHAASVVATDVNERALCLTRINARLNGLTVETRVGSLFEPVAGERFELIVSNPPFVVSPASELLFRDAGLGRDELSRQVTERLPDLLEAGGHASVLASWIVGAGEDWSDTPHRWLAASGCDAFVLHFTTDDALTYAGKYTAELEPWLDYYRAQGIEAIATGAIVLARRASGASPRFVALQATGGARGDGTRQLLRILNADELPDDDALLRTRFALAEPHRLDQRASFRDGRYTVGATTLSLPEGAGVNAFVETDAVHLLARLDGETPLGAVVERAARETGLERERLERAALASLRRLVRLGYVERV